MAIQKDGGRLADESKNLLFDAGLNFRTNPRVDFAFVDGDLPMQVWFRKNASIARVVEQGTEDFGILGLDMIKETGAKILPLLPLGFGRGEVYLGIRNNIPYSSIQDLAGRKVFTSYMTIAYEYFNGVDVEADLIEEDGGEESLINDERGDACVVFSETGDSKIFNNITAVESLLFSEAYLIANPSLREKRGRERLTEQFLRRIVSVLRTREYTYIVMNAPSSTRKQIMDILPSSQSPTISPLADPSWLAVASVVPRGKLDPINEALQILGVKDIVELEMKRMIPNKDDRVIIEMMEKIYG